MDTFRYLYGNNLEHEVQTFFEIAEEIRKAHNMRRSEFLRAAEILSQHQDYWKNHPGYVPTPAIMDRIQRNLKVRFLLDENLRIVGWEKANEPTPTSVRDVVSLSLDGAYQGIIERMNQLLESTRTDMDANERKRLEAEFDLLLSKMEDVKDEADMKLRRLFREAERTVTKYQITSEVGDETDNGVS